MIMNTTIPHGEQKSPTIGIRATTSGFSHQQIGIRAYGLKWCLIFCSKMKVVKIMFLPYHCVEEEETKPLVKMASKSDVGHARTRQHALERRLPRRTNVPHASHASSSPEWQTGPEYQMTQPIS
jgi:hypothetical protein